MNPVATANIVCFRYRTLSRQHFAIDLLYNPYLICKFFVANRFVVFLQTAPGNRSRRYAKNVDQR